MQCLACRLFHQIGHDTPRLNLRKPPLAPRFAARGAPPRRASASRDPMRAAHRAGVDVLGGRPAAFANGLGNRRLGPSYARLVAGAPHKFFPLAPMGQRLAPVKNKGRNVRDFVANDFAQRRGRALEQSRVQSDQARAGRAATQGALKALAEHDAHTPRKLGDVPGGGPGGQPGSVGFGVERAHDVILHFTVTTVPLPS